MDTLIIHSPILLIAIPLLAAFLTPLIGRASGKARDVLVVASLAFVEFLVIILARDIYLNGLHIYTLGASSPNLTIPENYIVPVRIILEVDSMSIFMAIISATVSLAAAIYSLSFMKGETGQNRFYTLLLLLVAGMLGMVLTGDLFNLFVFLEIASIAGAALTAFRTRFADTAEGGFKYIVISSLAALMVLFAIGIFYAQYNLINIAALAHVMQYTMLDKIALVLLVIAFMMKLAGVPLHMWCPDTYSVAPAGITIMLVVASYACLYALFRTCFTLYGISPDMVTVGWIVIITGMLTMFVGVTMAVFQTDIKRLMAYHCISQTGYMLLGIGVGLAVLNRPEALNTYGIAAMDGGIFHIINNALYKGLLFLTAGALFHRTGTRDLNKMGGLAHKMKWTTIFYIIGALSISGIPPSNGFASKLLIYESVYRFNPILAIVAMITSILTLASFTKAFYSAFMGAELPEYQEVKEVPKSMIAGMAILAAGVVFFSLFPGLVVARLAHPATAALISQGAYINGIMGGGG
ncbi:MAG: proton-conducting transporter membrane subunit [Dehalococcoidia bacterium]|nr:proton-conducting transporter membrane subunit [Dehalococcoidia bacterium]